MPTLKRTGIEIAILCSLALVLGFGINAVRGRDSINLTRNYFPPTSEAAVPTPAPVVADGGAEDMNVLPDDVQPDGLSDSEHKFSHAASEFKTITVEETIEFFNDPNTAAGVYLFVDARNDQAYAQGHIPGAVQCDHYRLEEFIDSVCQAADCAEKVIVYCEGGECEDSILLCRELLMADIPRDKLYLFQGGCQEWSANDMPCEKGDSP